MHTGMEQAFQWLERKVGPLIDNLKQMCGSEYICSKNTYVHLHANLASYLPFTKEWKEEEPPNTQEQVDTEEGEEVESAMVGQIVEEEEADTTQGMENQSGKASI